MTCCGWGARVPLSSGNGTPLRLMVKDLGDTERPYPRTGSFNSSHPSSAANVSPRQKPCSSLRWDRRIGKGIRRVLSTPRNPTKGPRVSSTSSEIGVSFGAWRGASSLGQCSCLSTRLFNQDTKALDLPSPPTSN